MQIYDTHTHTRSFINTDRYKSLIVFSIVSTRRDCFFFITYYIIVWSRLPSRGEVGRSIDRFSLLLMLNTYETCIDSYIRLFDVLVTVCDDPLLKVFLSKRIIIHAKHTHKHTKALDDNNNKRERISNHNYED